MTMPFASRHVPTLTDVVTPAELFTITPMHPAAQQTMPEAADERPLAAAGAPDANLLAQQILQQLKPQLEAQLHSIAQEWLQARFSPMLPALRLHLEASVRQAVERARADDPGNRNV
jgi:hypothetical protein